MVIGHRLDLYQTLAAGPARAEELAERTGTSPRYIAEWLRGQAAGGYVEYDPAEEAYSMTEEQAVALADPDGAVYVPGAFVLALGTPNNTYVQIVEFPSYQEAMANSGLPETGEFAEKLARLCDGLPVFRNLDVRQVDTFP